MINHTARRLFRFVFRSYARILVVSGLVILIGTAVILPMRPAKIFLIQIGASIGIGLVLFAVMLRPNAVHVALTGRRIRYASNMAIVCLAFVAILVIVNFLGLKHNFEFDLTETREFTLSEETIKVLESLSEPVQIVGFFGSDDHRWTKTKVYLERYSRYTEFITFGLHDPDTELALAQSYGLESYGLVFVSGVYDYQVSKVDEQAITTGLMCVTTHRHNQESVKLVSPESRHPSDRHFSLTLFQTSLIFFITLIVIPLIPLVAGHRVWWMKQ